LQISHVGLHALLRLRHVHSDDSKALIAFRLPQRFQGGKLPPAVGSPCPPEDDDRGRAGRGGDADGVALQIREREVRRADAAVEAHETEGLERVRRARDSLAGEAEQRAERQESGARSSHGFPPFPNVSRMYRSTPLISSSDRTWP